MNWSNADQPSAANNDPAIESYRRRTQQLLVRIKTAN